MSDFERDVHTVLLELLKPRWGTITLICQDEKQARRVFEEGQPSPRFHTPGGPAYRPDIHFALGLYAIVVSLGLAGWLLWFVLFDWERSLPPSPPERHNDPDPKGPGSPETSGSRAGEATGDSPNRP